MLVVFDLTTEEIKVMDGVPDHLSVGQVRRKIAHCDIACRLLVVVAMWRVQWMRIGCSLHNCKTMILLYIGLCSMHRLHTEGSM